MSSIFGITKYLHTNSKITYPLVKFFFLQKKKKKKKVKRVILSHIQKKKKKLFSFVFKCLYLLVFVIYLNSNTSIMFIKKIYKINFSKKKAHYLTEKLLILILYSNV